jgi:phage-related protein
MGPGLWELRSTIPDGIARVFFTVWKDHVVPLHGFVKKSAKTPDNELKTAHRRLAEFQKNAP